MNNPIVVDSGQTSTSRSKVKIYVKTSLWKVERACELLHLNHIKGLVAQLEGFVQLVIS
jgi:hypothetical protein